MFTVVTIWSSGPNPGVVNIFSVMKLIKFCVVMMRIIGQTDYY